MSTRSVAVADGIDQLRKAERRMVKLFRANRGRWYSSRRLASLFGGRFSARIFNLRRAGVPIVTRRTGSLAYSYSLPKGVK